jgi:O-antigen/teichoic acid export membrane protein
VQDLGAVLAPKFSTIERYTPRLDNMLKLISLVMGIAIILFVIFALPDLVVLVYGPAYRESVLYAQVLVGAVSVHNIATLRFRFIRAKLDATSFRNILVVGSVAKIAASATLIPLFGLGGATASVFFHRFVLAGVIGHTIRKKYLNDANG